MALIQTSKDALRNLVRQSRFSLLAVGTLALGVASAAVLFSLIAGTLLTPSPLHEPDRLMVLHRPNATQGDLGHPDIADLAARGSSFAAVGAIWPGYALDSMVDDRPRRLGGALVDSGWWRATAVRPLLGRVFGPENDMPGGDRVAVVAETFWRNRLDARQSAVGSSIELNGVPHTVIGVVPDSADALRGGVEVWAPLWTAGDWVTVERGANVFDSVARLADGVAPEAAQSDVDALMASLAEAHPKTNQGKSLVLTPLDRFLHAEGALLLWTLQAATLVLLAIAVVNLGALLLVRGTSRAQEYRMRAALGADRRALLGLLMVEGVIIGLGGWLIGVAGAKVVLAAAGQWLIDALPGHAAHTLDDRVLLASLVVAVAGAVIASLAPALAAARAARPDPTRGHASGTERRALATLLVAEIALACVLVVGAGLLLRSLQSLASVPLGFRPGGVLSAQIVLPESRYGTREPQTRAITAMTQALQDIPGVRRASFATGAPLQPNCCIGSRLIAEDVPQPPNEEIGVRVRPVHGDYFKALDVPLQHGRTFNEHDDADAPLVAVVNLAMARKLYGVDDPVGRRIAWRPGSTGSADEAPRWMEVVGVVADVRAGTLRQEDSAAVYLPYVQRQREWVRFGTFLIEVHGEPSSYASAMQEAIASVDARVPLTEIMPLQARLLSASSSERFAAGLASAFAVLAWLLSLQGVLAVVAFVVSRQRHELGLRAALGAAPGALQALVVRRGLVIATLGLCIGVPAALLASSKVESLLFAVDRFDSASLLFACLLVGGSALLACWLPARRAARIDPAEALRCE